MSVTQILVVDDFLPWQRFISQMFESEPDLKITSVASDGFEAVQKAKELQPDVILMDVSLPGMNGFEATRQIRVFSPGSKILFLSEHRGSDLIQAAFDVGGFGYVLKSDSHSDLVFGIRAVLLDRQFVSHSLKNWRRSPDSTL
jgi:DNA-binding NarL/FixJ family response regulator